MKIDRTGLGAKSPDGQGLLSQTEYSNKVKQNETKVKEKVEKEYKIPLPPNESQLKHIFRKSSGHLVDNPKNRETLLELVNDKSNYCGTDKKGRMWYVKKGKNGAQYWAWIKNGKINDGGYNKSPKNWNSETGLCAPIPKNTNPLKKKKGGI